MSSATAAPSSASVPFPWKLHEMLERSEPDKFDHIVSWLPAGTGFKVHDPVAFVRDILPRYFRQTKYKSFQRQCNIWNYERILHGPEKGGYIHPEGFFQRGNAHLCSKMKRVKIKGATGNPATSSTADVSKMSRSISVISHGSLGSDTETSATATVPPSGHTRSISPSSPIQVESRTYSANTTTTAAPTTNQSTVSLDSYRQLVTASSSSAFHEIPVSPTPSSDSQNDAAAAPPSPQTGDCVPFEGQNFFFIGDEEYAKDKQAEEPRKHQRRLSFNLFAACREESDAALVEMLVAEASPTAEFSLTSSSYFY